MAEIELVIERWGRTDGAPEYRWSVWHDGRRVLMGGPAPSAEAAEREGAVACRGHLGCAPGRVERL